MLDQKLKNEDSIIQKIQGQMEEISHSSDVQEKQQGLESVVQFLQPKMHLIFLDIRPPHIYRE